MSLSRQEVQRIGSLIDELKSEDPKRRKNSIGSLRDIAKALGPEKTRNELIGFLNGTNS